MTALTQSFNSVAMIKYCVPVARVSDFKLCMCFIDLI